MSTSMAPSRVVPLQHKRQPKASYDPLKERAKELADILWERAMDIADVLAPEVPADQEELDPQAQWMLLERVAMNLSPAAWDDPEAIEDLLKLRRRFAPHLAHPWLETMAKYRRKEQSGLPDPAITPENPDFAKQQRRLTE